MRSWDEPIVSCPFNPEHKMRQTRLIWHLGKGCQDKVNRFISDKSYLVILDKI